MNDLARSVFRDHVSPLLSTPGLEALRVALSEDSPELIQGANTRADSELWGPDDACVGACPLALCGWRGEGLRTVLEVETYFAALVNAVCTRNLEPALVSYLLQWIDNTDRQEMRRDLLVEVSRALARRPEGEGDSVPTSADES